MLGIFDSGVGGLTVVKELLRRKPTLSFIYLGDRARVPYGDKNPETIKQFAEEEARFLHTQGVTDIIIACNTTSLHVEYLRGVFPDIRFFDVIAPTVEMASAGPGQKIGVIGTRATIASGIYQKSLHISAPQKKVFAQACPLFVPLAEERWEDRPETQRIARRYLQPLRQAQIDTLILGCTHYPLLARAIRHAMPRRVNIIDSPSALLDHIERAAPDVLLSRDTKIKIQQRFCFTEVSDYANALATRWLGREVRGEKVSLA